MMSPTVSGWDILINKTTEFNDRMMPHMLYTSGLVISGVINMLLYCRST